MDHPGTGSAVPPAAQRPQDRPDAPLDGNALAGPLGLVFTGDLTVASVVCAGCGRSELLAALPVFGAPMGLVARCPGCGAAMICCTDLPTGRTLQLGGTAVIQVPAS